MTASPAIAIHVAVALAALLLGGALLFMHKSTPRHRMLGRSWALILAATAVSSFWIKTHGHYSWIHLLSVWALFALGMALASIVRGNVRAHRYWITGVYVGLVMAGTFALLPHRLLGAQVWRTAGLMQHDRMAIKESPGLHPDMPSLPSIGTAPARAYPRLRRLAINLALTTAFNVLIALVITYLTPIGTSFGVSLVFSMCIGTLALLLIDGSRLLLWGDNCAILGRHMIPLVAIAMPLAYFAGHALAMRLLGMNAAHLPRAHAGFSAASMLLTLLACLFGTWFFWSRGKLQYLEAQAAQERARTAAIENVLFLDIRMPGKTGLEAAQELADEWPAGPQDKPFPLIVFVTAYDEFALAAFEQAAADYVCKPVSDERLGKTVERLQERLHARSAAQASAPGQAGGDGELSRLLEQLRALAPGLPPGGTAAPPRLTMIRAAVGNQVRMIPVEDVVYFEATDKYLTVATATGEALIRTSLKELLPQLDPQRFWQVHRGTVVNTRSIAAALRDEAGKVSLKLHGRSDMLAVSRVYPHLFRQM